MTRRARPARAALFAFAALVSLVALGAGDAGASLLKLRTVASGLARPIFVTAPPGDTSRLFVVSQSGVIRVLDLQSEEVLATPFLNLGATIVFGGEQGLLGLAFHPDYATNGFFYVNYTAAGTGATVVRRFQVSADPDVADAGSGQTVLTFTQPQANHNGGWLGFGLDDYLYVATGDGGNSNDQGPGHTEPGGNAQDLEDNPLGKILRLDVDGDDFPTDAARNYAIPPDNPFVGVAGDDEIWVYGLRNPWRASFDRETGDLYIGDVGQGAREEVDVQPATSSGGENYGWRLREGTIMTPGGNPPVGGNRPPGNVDPIYDYPRPGSLAAVVGGYVYRGPLAWLHGTYFFSDSYINEVWSLQWDGSDPADFDGTNHFGVTTWTDDPAFLPGDGRTVDVPVSFGEDAAGNLYLVDLGFGAATGEVFLVPEPEVDTLAGAAVLMLAWLVRRRGHRLATARRGP